MTEQEWKWYSGSNGDSYENGPFDTRDQAVTELDGYGGYVILARKVPMKLSSYFDVDRLLDDAEETAYDMANENGDPLFDVTEEQSDDLTERVKVAIDAWQYAHGLTFMPWSFSQTKNEERIEADQ